MMRQGPKVGEILVKAGVIDEMQLRAALGDQQSWGQRLGVTLVKMGLVEERDLVRALAQQLQLPVIQLEGKKVQREVLDLVPAEFADKHLCVPLFIKEQGDKRTLFVGMDDPGNLEAIDDLGFRTGMKVQPVLVPPSELCEAIDRFYHRVGDPAPEQGPGGISLEPEQQPTSDSTIDDAQLAGSLFRTIEPENTGEEPEIPDDFAPIGAEVEAAVQGTAAVERTAPVPPAAAVEPTVSALPLATSPAPPPAVSSAASDDTNRTILRALCQLLIEKGLIDRDELHARARQLKDEKTGSE